MTQNAAPSPAELKPWQRFSRRHKNHPYLNINPLYALPKGFIDIILAQMPGVWTAAEANFEKDLAETAIGGFFHKLPFRCPFLPAPSSARELRVNKNLEEFRRELMRDSGLHDSLIQLHLRDEQRQNEDTDLRELAYTAWLITNDRFLAERDAYRVLWEDLVRATGRFPSHRLNLLGTRAQAVGEDEARLLFFYRHWAIDTFLTWDIPVPMPAQFHQVIYQDTLSLGEAGLCLFLPWYLLRDGQFTLQDLAKQLRRETAPSHLEGWFSHTAGRQSELGYKRLKNFLKLYWCYRLVLQDRYANQLCGRIEQFDRAFARYLGLGSDSVKKLRLSMSHLK